MTEQQIQDAANMAAVKLLEDEMAANSIYDILKDVYRKGYSDGLTDAPALIERMKSDPDELKKEEVKKETSTETKETSNVDTETVEDQAAKEKLEASADFDPRNYRHGIDHNNPALSICGIDHAALGVEAISVCISEIACSRVNCPECLAVLSSKVPETNK